MPDQRKYQDPDPDEMVPGSEPDPTPPADAALAEDEPKTLTFRDVELTLPPELPGMVLFDLTEIEASGENPMPIFRLLRTILGPEQFTRVRNALDPAEPIIVAVDDLISSIFKAYGLTLGEAAASDDS